MLLDNGFDVNINDENGDTPLQIAIRENRPGIVKLLLEYGANVNAKDKQGLTPLFAAIVDNHPEGELRSFNPISGSGFTGFKD